MKSIFVLFVLLMVIGHAWADTKQFCSQSPVNFTTAHEPNGYEATLNSAATLTPGDCQPTPPPVACTRPPTLASSTTTIANYTLDTSASTVYYFGAGTKTGADLTKLLAIVLPPGVVKEWPGVRGVGFYFIVPTNKYVSAAFTVPSGYLATQPANVYGFYAIGEQQNNAPVSETISTSCGDFSSPLLAGSTVVPGCWFNKAGPDQGLYWKANTHCALAPGGNYYLNLINADISTLTPNGGGSAASTINARCSTYSCQMSLTNGPGNWTN